jgi:hypothetical protein
MIEPLAIATVLVCIRRIIRLAEIRLTRPYVETLATPTRQAVSRSGWQERSEARTDGSSCRIVISISFE